MKSSKTTEKTSVAIGTDGLGEIIHEVTEYPETTVCVTETTETTEITDTTEESEHAEQVDSEESLETIEATEATEAVEVTEANEVTEAVEAVEVTEAVEETSESTKSTEIAKEEAITIYAKYSVYFEIKKDNKTATATGTVSATGINALIIYEKINKLISYDLQIQLTKLQNIPKNVSYLTTDDNISNFKLDVNYSTTPFNV